MYDKVILLSSVIVNLNSKMRKTVMMKYFIFSWMLVVSLLGGTIQNDDQFKAVVSAIATEDKMILMIYTSDDCPECAYMKQKVFQDKSVEPYLKRNFVVIEKNVHKSKLPDGYDYFGIPTMFFIDKAGIKKDILVGSKRPKDFVKILYSVRDKK